jgi:hypothetical protein
MNARTRPRAAAALTLVAAAIIGGCHQNQSAAPTSPSTPTSPSPVRLEISGPARIEPGQFGQFTATATLTDGTQQDYTGKVTWFGYPLAIVSVDHAGRATGVAVGKGTVAATTNQGQPCCSATAAVVIMPANTFQLTGRVLESGLGLAGARVSVTSGTGTGFNAMTDDDGNYALYGVAGSIQVTVTDQGYDPIVKTANVVRDDVLDFPDAHQTAALPSLAGAYTLTMGANPSCHHTGSGPLPAELLQQRNYSALIAQDGAALAVRLTDAAIVPSHDQFTGHITPTGVEFVMGSGYYDYTADDAVSAWLTDTRIIAYTGFVRTNRSGTLVGPFAGNIGEWAVAAGGFSFIAQCTGSQQFVLTPAAGGPSRR